MKMLRNLILLAPAVAFMTLLGAMVWGRDTMDLHEQETTKVSEQRARGKYTRTTEVFRDGVRVSRKRESSLTGDSNFVLVVTDLFRGDQRVFQMSSHRTDNDNSRLYFQGNRITVQEVDKDGDGWFESMILFDDKELPIEAFTKTQSGMVELWSSPKLTELRKAHSRLREIEVPARVQGK